MFLQQQKSNKTKSMKFANVTHLGASKIGDNLSYYLSIENAQNISYRNNQKSDNKKSSCAES